MSTIFNINAWDKIIIPWKIVAPNSQSIPEKDLKLLNYIKSKVNYSELNTGLEIKTRQHIGLIPFTNFTIYISPRISNTTFLGMAGYCYGINDISLLYKYGNSMKESQSLIELLVKILSLKIKQLLNEGVHKNYQTEIERPNTIKGSILFNQLATSAIPTTTLPCRYQKLTADILINQIILSTLHFVFPLVHTPDLKREVLRTRTEISQYCSRIKLSNSIFNEALNSINRLNQRYSSIIELCYFLFNSIGSKPKGIDDISFPGYLIDANKLFEAFIYKISRRLFFPEKSVYPQKQLPSLYSEGHPYLRPDCITKNSDGEIEYVIDAKYKFYENRPSVQDIYQLTIYGLTIKPESRKAIGLFPSEEPNVQKYSVRKDSGDFLQIRFIGINIGKMLNFINNPTDNEYLDGLLSSFDS